MTHMQITDIYESKILRFPLSIVSAIFPVDVDGHQSPLYFVWVLNSLDAVEHFRSRNASGQQIGLHSSIPFTTVHSNPDPLSSVIFSRVSHSIYHSLAIFSILSLRSARSRQRQVRIMTDELGQYPRSSEVTHHRKVLIILNDLHF